MHSPRVLVADDDPIIAMEIAQILTDDGCEVVASPGTVPAALAIVRSEKLDLALLDISLGAQPMEPVASALTRRDIPFAVVTAYPPRSLPAIMRGHPVVQKPFAAREIRQLAEDLSAAAQ